MDSPVSAQLGGSLGAHVAARGDVIVMDVRMLVMDGHEATRELRRQGFEGAIRALTASAVREDEQRVLPAGCDAYPANPIEGDALVNKVAELADGETLARLRAQRG